MGPIYVDTAIAVNCRPAMAAAAEDHPSDRGAASARKYRDE